MTKGAPLGHLFLYAVPLLLGNWLQLAYNAVDSIIAGRFIGQDALAAEGVAGPVMNLVILAISGSPFLQYHRRSPSVRMSVSPDAHRNSLFCLANSCIACVSICCCMASTPTTVLSFLISAAISE